MAVVAVDDVDLRLVGAEATAQTVRDHRAAGAAAEDDDLRPVHAAPPGAGALPSPPTLSGSSVISRCWPSITTSCRSVSGIERAVAVRLMVEDSFPVGSAPAIGARPERRVDNYSIE